ncbi:MAG: hypothetical protein II947_05440 [Bacteroidaceae bacterium]|nr:hypothetical protein [Bacteroidaceae bacterium]
MKDRSATWGELRFSINAYLPLSTLSCVVQSESSTLPTDSKYYINGLKVR